MNKNQNNYICTNPSVRQSFAESLSAVKEQLGEETYQDGERQEIALIMAETLLLNPDSLIRIAGEKIRVEIVQEIFSCITSDHVDFVIDNLHRQRTKIKNIKAYIRTALYNSVFEIDTHYSNQVRSELGFGGTA